MFNRITFLITGILASALVALISGGLAVPRTVTPAAGEGLLSAIGGDGWVTSQSRILYPETAGAWNSLRLEFNPWRPEGLQPAHLRVASCGQKVAEFQVTESASHFEFPLAGNCSPLSVAFEVANPFSPGGGDGRELGVQLRSVEIGSKIGIPIRSPQHLIKITFAFTLLVFLAVAALPRTVPKFLPMLAVLATAGVLHALESPKNGENLIYLWCFSALFLAGAVLYTAWGADREDGRRSIAESSFFPLMLVSIVVLAAAFRFYGLSFGLPENYHPDEVPKVMAIERMKVYGDLNPRYFLHPSLLLYLTYFTSELFQWFGVSGSWPEVTVLAGRTVSAVAGTLSVLFVGLIGRRIVDPAGGLLAALLLALMPLHITCSRYLKEDALLTAVVLACTLSVVKAVQQDRLRFLYLAGFLAGVAASSKYTGMLTGAIVFAAPWLRSQRFLPDWRYAKHTFAALLLLPLGFLACTPYSLLNYAKFSRDFGYEQRHMMKGHTASITAWSQLWMYHFSRSFIPGVHVTIAVLGSVALGILVRSLNITALFVVASVLLFYLPAEWVRAKPAPQPERYILPCLPFMALALPLALRHLRKNLPYVGVTLAVAAIAFCSSGWQSYRLALSLKDDTRKQMGRWIEDNIPPGSRIYVDWKRYGPEIDEGRYQVTYLPRTNTLQALHVRNLKQSGNEYLVLSSLYFDRYFSQPNASPAEREIVRAVFRHLEQLKEVSSEVGTYGFHNPTLVLFKIAPEEGSAVAGLTADKSGA